MSKKNILEEFQLISTLIYTSGSGRVLKSGPDSNSDSNTDLNIFYFMNKTIIEECVHCAFPNIEIALRIYFTLMVTNSSSERSFSKMKLIKNRLRTSMCQERLNSLTLLSIEYDILREIDMNQIIDKFAYAKSRKAPNLVKF